MTISRLGDNFISRYFIHAMLIGTLIVSKFGVVLGTSYIGVSHIMWYLYALVLFTFDQIQINKTKFIFYLIIIIALTVVVLLQITVLEHDISILSFALLASLYVIITVEPSAKFDNHITIDIFIFYTRLITICGIAQYGLQYVGIDLHSFGSLLPSLEPFLLEKFFNSDAVLEYGSTIRRSNGFFLKEPSAFSQLLVLGSFVEFFIKRRLFFLPIYGIGYLTTFSGTGLLAALFSIIIYSLMSLRRAILLPIIFMIGSLIAAFLIIIVPETADIYLGRLGEFGSTESSAYSRYVAQYFAWNDMINSGAILPGNGPGAFSSLYAPFRISTNAILKLTSDYGIFAAVSIMSFFLYSIWWEKYPLISLYFLGAYLLAGNAELSPEFLILASIICVWSHPSTTLYQTRGAVQQSFRKRSY